MFAGSPSKKNTKDRLGHVAVGFVLAAALVVSYACDSELQDDGVVVAAQAATPERQIVSAAELRQPVPPDEPVEEAPPAPLPPVSYDEAETAYHEQRYREAMELFTRYTEDKPRNAWGFYMLGMSSWKAGDPLTAEYGFVRALDLDARHVKSLLNLSRVLLDQARAEDALPHVEAVLAIDAKSVPALRTLGRILHELGDVEGAVEAFRTAITLDETDVWSMNNLGYVLLSVRRYDEALTPLAKAVDLVNNEPVFFNNLGIVLEHLGHIVASADVYEIALELDETYAKAEQNLARVEAWRGADLGPVDLSAVARSFDEEVLHWELPSVDTEEYPEPATDDVSEPATDSLLAVPGSAVRIIGDSARAETRVVVSDSTVRDEPR